MKFESLMTIELKEDIGDTDLPDYSARLELPYGTYDAQLHYRLASAVEGEEAWALKPADTKCLPYFTAVCDPKPISREQQQELDDKEEKENKDRENEARIAQKKLEDEKTKIRQETQQKILKQEQNSAKLKAYFRAMNLSFHKESATHNCEEDFNASMSTTSVYHLELFDNFNYYASQFTQHYTRRTENQFIVLQGFFHFLKQMKMVSYQSDVKDLFDNTLHEIEGVMTPINDTLNIKNGMNYAMFLEAILRICYYRAENEGIPYKRVLDQVFNDAGNNIDI